MIEEVRLINWKSFEDTTLYIEPLTAIIGCNASGKSNIFDALKFVSLLANGMPYLSATHNIRGGDENIVRKGQSSAILEIKIYDDKRDKSYIYKIEAISNNEELIGGVDCGIELKDNSEKELFRYNIKYGYGYQVPQLNIECNNYPIFKKLQNIFLLDPIPHNMRDYSPVGKDLKEDASNIAGVIASMGEEEGKKLQNRLTKLANLLPERDIVEVWSEKVGRLGKDAMIYCKEKWTDNSENILDASGMSDGTLRFIAIITALLTRPEGSLLMVEEIDNGLHPSRVKDLVKALKEIGAERHIDILFTTHNPTLIDALGSELLPCITYIKRNPETGSSEINTLDQNENLFQIVSRGSIGDSMIEGRI